MEKCRKLFGGIRMSWRLVLTLAVVTGVWTAFAALLPAFDDTSFDDIAVVPDVWFVFAIFIVINCDKWWEASVKCFVFFLVSQPLVYLLQVPFSPDGFGLFRYYGYWFTITLLTLPGAAIAFLVKRKDWLSVAVLSVATGYLSLASVSHFRTAFTDWPRHIFSAVFCLAAAVFLVFILLNKKSHRITALAVILAVFSVAAAYTGLGLRTDVKRVELDEGTWTCTDSGSGLVRSENDGSTVTVFGRRTGYDKLKYTDENGRVAEIYVTVKGGKVLTDVFYDE